MYTDSQPILQSTNLMWQISYFITGNRGRLLFQ